MVCAHCKRSAATHISRTASDYQRALAVSVRFGPMIECIDKCGPSSAILRASRVLGRLDCQPLESDPAFFDRRYIVQIVP